MSPNDIKFYRSTGDLGGVMTTNDVDPDTLFDTVDRKKTQKLDYIDYRCFYIFNNHATDTFFDAKLFIESERRFGSFIDIGIPVLNEKQQLLFTGAPWEGDTIELGIDDDNVVVDYYYNVTKWQGDMQTKIRGIDNLQDVIVEVAGTVPNVTFTINFLGSACCRDFLLISEVATTLHDTTMSVVQIQAGSPIKTTAQTIPSAVHRPTGILFGYPLQGNPVALGNLRPQEGFPVWVRRTTRKGTTVGMKDNFVLRVDGASV